MTLRERLAKITPAAVDDVHVPGDALGRSYTPRPVAEAIVRRLRPRFLGSPVRVWEPCVGGGSIAEAMRSLLDVALLVGTDLDPEAPGRRLCDRFEVADARTPRPGEFGLSGTNPPFGKAVGQSVTVAIVASLRASAAVAFAILPADTVCQAGFESHVAAASDVWPLLPRPWNHERGMAVLVWDTAHTGPTRFEPLRWRHGADTLRGSP